MQPLTMKTVAVVVLKRACLRRLEPTMTQSLLRLDELSGSNICSVLISNTNRSAAPSPFGRRHHFPPIVGPQIVIISVSFVDPAEPRGGLLLLTFRAFWGQPSWGWLLVEAAGVIVRNTDD